MNHDPFCAVCEFQLTCSTRSRFYCLAALAADSIVSLPSPSKVDTIATVDECRSHVCGHSALPRNT